MAIRKKKKRDEKNELEITFGGHGYYSDWNWGRI